MKAYIMGNYTEKAFQGFMKDPTSDRKAVVEQLTKAVGGTIHSMDIVRGSYDFIVVTDIGAFENFAAIKLVVEASGAVKNMTMLEAIDFTKAFVKSIASNIVIFLTAPDASTTNLIAAKFSNAPISVTTIKSYEPLTMSIL